MNRSLPLAVGLLAFALLGPAPGEDPPKRNKPLDWVNFVSREQESGAPKLAVVYADGTKREYEAEADATVIAYRPELALGTRTRVLSVNLSDSNRALVRFPELDGKIKKAELVFTLPGLASPDRPGMLPARQFDLAVGELKAEWDEDKVTWETQPGETDTKPATGTVDPTDSELRIDVTHLTVRLADPKAVHFGWVVRVAKPIEVDALSPGMGKKQEKEVLDLLPWAKSVDDAVKQAAREDKLVLAVVRPVFQPDASHYAEQMLVVGVLSEPDVRQRLLSRFVLVRVAVSPITYLQGKEGGGRDPLDGLGVTVWDAKPPAVVITDAKGEKVAAQTSIGTFDRDLMLRFLDRAQEKAGRVTSKDADPWRQLAAGDSKAAEGAFAKKDDRGGRFGLARVASVRGDHKKALELARLLATTDGEFKPEAQLLAGLSLVRLGRFADAEPLLKAAAASKAECAGEAAYLLGCVLYRHDAEQAAKVWKELANGKAGTPVTVRAKARLAWPVALAQDESLTAFDLPSDLSSTEVNQAQPAEAVRRGVEFLLRHQEKGGSWTTPSQSNRYRAAATAVAARALHKWSGELDKDLGAKARAASEEATKWLNTYLKDVDPEVCSSFGAAFLLDYFVDLEESKAVVKGDTKGAIKLLLAGQMKNGAWSYDLSFGNNWTGEPQGWPKTNQGRAHSVNTGQALLALARAKAAGFAVDADQLAAGKKALLDMREAPAVYTYTYPIPRNFTERPEFSIGRAPMCEHALRVLGGNDATGVEKAVALFMEHRGDLRPVAKLTQFWNSKVASSSYFYAYDHAARAVVHNGTDVGDRLARLKADILKVGEADGSWVDFEESGKPFGTGMALHVLYLAK